AASWPSFLLSRFPPPRRCTPRPELRRRCNRLRRRSTRRDLFIDLSGQNRGSQGKELFWLPSINRPARSLGPECFRAPGTNNWTVRLSKRIRSGVSNQAQDPKLRFPSSLRHGQNLRRPNEQRRSRRFFIHY